MRSRALISDGDTPASDAALDAAVPDGGWKWVDIELGPSEVEELVGITSLFGLDSLAVRDAVEDRDLPKFDDFGSQLLLVMHGLRDDRIGTYEVDCFLTAKGEMVTIHESSSPSINHLWSQVLHHGELARGTVDELAARLADIMTRRLVKVLDAFDGRIDELVNLALAADPGLVAELTAVRSDLATVRRAVNPQRETLDLLRSSPSPLLSDAGRRRFSDVFDVAARAAHGIDAARTSLAETLDAYRGAEARNATEMTRVLTVYAAVVLPLSFIAGFFGMNFENLPWTRSDAGWIVASVVMAVVGVVSLGIFVSVGWIRRPSGRSAGTALGRGLIEAARTPVEVAGALYEISTLPLRSVVRRRGDEPRP